MSTEDICQKISCSPPDVKRLNGYILKVSTKSSMNDCKDAGKRLLELIWVETDKSVDPAQKKIRSRLCAKECKTKMRGYIKRALLASQFFSALPRLEAVEALVSIMMSVSCSNIGKPSKLRHHDTSQTHFQGTAQRLIHIRLPAGDRQKLW